ncbi:MAG: hypothetical protein C4K48_06815 [Candidatus Thorarchaeota archaeon]|nr:MAG: hypothetical protein C4K48_06815 [Candidatus Thorarchaeota archaeon]
MDVPATYARLCGEVSHFTKEKTGTSLVDAYFGPEALDPIHQRKGKSPEELVGEVKSLIDGIRDEIDSQLRADHLIGECESICVVVEWLAGRKIPYADLVHDIFHIPMKRFSDRAIKERIAVLDDALTGFSGSDLRERVAFFVKRGEITGAQLQHLIEGELQTKAAQVGEMFKRRIHSVMGTDVTDNGVEYQTVRGAPWSGYNWYQPGFKSINQFNLDVTFNIDTLYGVIFHEYEHHVSNLWREKYYRESGDLELAVVPLHTGRCVISEGTADTAREFLGVVEDNPNIKIAEALNTLRRMTSINAAIMLNDRGRTVDEAVDYMIEYGFRTPESARSAIGFISPRTSTGGQNFWAPYIFTYYFGKTDFVLPVFNKAAGEGELTRFFQTLYLNPYSGSSVTWKQAFDWLN